MLQQVTPVPDGLFDAIGSRSRWSDAVRAGDTVYVTGQLGWDKTTGVLVDGLEAQVEQALSNLADVLDAAGAAIVDVVQTRIYLTDHSHYSRYEPIYERFFGGHSPARVSVVVAELIHHALFDIEAIAVVGSGRKGVVID